MGAPVGNQNARKAKDWASAIKRALAKEEGYEAGLDRLAGKLVKAADAGDQWALIEIGNRLDGKPAQVIAGDDDLPPVKVEGRVKLVRPG